jgi:hypothetical protein
VVKGGVVFVAFRAGMIETRVAAVVASGGIGVGIDRISPGIFSRENIVWFGRDKPLRAVSERIFDYRVYFTP